jgi:site-specific DNA-methyltransferase (adenine-specific)
VPSLPKPYYQDQAITIYHADCREILPLLQPASADLILTDPPYGISYQSKNTTGRFSKTIANDDSLNAMRDSLPQLDRILKPDRHLYFFAAPTKIGEAADALAAYWKLKNFLVWDKGNAGTRGDLEAGYGVNWEAILYGSKGRRPRSSIRSQAAASY